MKSWTLCSDGIVVVGCLMLVWKMGDTYGGRAKNMGPRGLSSVGTMFFPAQHDPGSLATSKGLSDFILLHVDLQGISWWDAMVFAALHLEFPLGLELRPGWELWWVLEWTWGNNSVSLRGHRELEPRKMVSSRGHSTPHDWNKEGKITFYTLAWVFCSFQVLIHVNSSVPIFLYFLFYSSFYCLSLLL